MIWAKLILHGLVAQFSFSQTTWTGGPGHLGPTPFWGDTFYAETCITWNEFPTLIRLTGVIENLPEHMIDPTIGGWDNDPDVGDLDQDGDLDVIATDESDPDIVAWYQNDGTGNFTKHIIDPDIYSVDEAFMVDLDRDGDNDLVVASDPRSGKDLIWYENDGAENFVGHVIDVNIGGAPEGEGVFVEDMDRDGDLDIVASWLRGGLFWYENNGAQVFTKRTIWTSATAISAWNPWVADFDADGDMDIVLTTSTAFYLFISNGGNPPTFTRQTVHGVGTYGLWCKDIDKDGDLDMVTTGREYNRGLYWYENDGLGNFTVHTVDMTMLKPMGVHAVDVDPDGDVDFVVADQDGSAIYFYDNQGNMTFIRRTLATGRHFFGMFMGDLDNDGDADVLVRAGTQLGKEGLLWYETRLWYDTPGVLISSILNSGVPTIWDNAYFGANVPPPTRVEIWVRASNDPVGILSEPWGGPITVSGTSMNGLLVQSTRYFQYRIVMSTTDRWVSPTVDSVAFTGHLDPNWDEVGEGKGVAEPRVVFGPRSLDVYLPTAGAVSVYDATGRRVFSGNGTHLTYASATRGVYTVVAEMGNKTITRSGVLLGGSK